jgi:sporulation protein YlmC with PRC-barrel domain
MTRISDIEDAPLYGSAGERLGTVESVLFHPCEPVAVAVMVKPDPALYVVPLPSAFVALAETRLEGESVRWDGAKLPSRKKTEAALGVDMDETVIWRGMPVVSPSGALIGSLSDGDIGEAGEVLGLTVSTGGMGDVAFGRLDVPAVLVRGFDGRAVVVESEPDELEPSGGLAKQAAAAATAVQTGVDSVVDSTSDIVVGSSYIAGRAIRSAVHSAPVKKTRSAFKGIADAFKEGYRKDEKK